ncbi:MAG: exonuclease domain-containing protein [Chitinophagales bacterium]
MYTIIDIEATGGSPKRDKITEIAIFLYDGEKIIDSFSSLINPEIHIPPFITNLTGITNEMVATAPKFSDIAERVLELTQNAVFVAHNVQFDYAYIKAEFKRLGHLFQRQKVCTVNLSKKILPNQASYSLGNLCEDLQIGIQNPHRAEDDAKATVELFKILLDNDSNNYIEGAITEKSLHKNIPAHLSPDLVHNLPEETGVYFLHNINDKVIFVGKSADIQRRIIQHINNNATSKKKLYKMLQNTHNITYQETGSELLASLLESYEIQRLRPSYNRLRRARRPKYGIFKYYHPTKHYLHIKIQEIKAEDVPIIAFPKKEYADKLLTNRIKKHRLCRQFCHFEPSLNGENGMACPNYAEDACNGACIDKERASVYNKRARQALKDLEYSQSHFFIVGEGRDNEELSIIYIENNRFMGYCFMNKKRYETLEPTAIRSKIEQLPHHHEFDKIIRAYLKKNKLDKIIKLK